MSGNNTSTNQPPTTTTSPEPAPTTTSSSPPANPPSSTAPSTEPSSTPGTTLPSTSSEPPPSTSAPPPSTTTTTNAPPSTTPTPTTTSNAPTTSSPIPTTIITSDGVTRTIQQTITQTNPNNTPSSSSSGTTVANQGPTDKPSEGLQQPAKIAIAVVVPIVGVAILIFAGIYFWRKRKARKDLEEQRRKEVEDYTYNPNADPTLPAVGGAGAGGYEMKEDGSSGYRGWGSTTLAGSTGRKASTTMSGGGGGVAYSDATSPTRGGVSDTRSGDPMVNDGTHSPEGEILGAMGPSAANNRGADVHRGPSNASSSYSAAGRSDGSGDIGVAYGGDGNGYNQYGQSSPYADQYGSPPRASELGGDGPVIRDNPARRNTRIESTGHYPQQSAGISQNF